ncbi:isocitrate lyase/PEP mutase family protein [Fructobacillus ficulneus]|uniref:Putative carboxyvinyl-carboxyphosphonate phosphorylmutase n=1 Tax=Fructobacillus ficulneus TaxID=157463 RepID=A0A0K8MG85_9LACO|nr:isocitrate lyase/PEP mutase family protein [Fructobacillus ficulneus]GAO99467.1 putative carboxyvinyl-carboxyphosphonate phosphorylmutase [Fructobacillus ficulneus]
MRNFEKQRNEFNHLIYDKEILNIVVVPDALAAKVAEKAGFKAVFCAGYATSASTLGLPDRGILDFGEMYQKVKEIVAAVDIPVFVDGDTGYGDPENVARTIRCYEAAGAAGIFLEDQVWPKRCGHMAGKSVVPTEELEEKLRVAAAARRHDNFLIMSRTDSRQMYGLDEAINRSKRYKAAGADMIFIEAPESIAEMKIIADTFPDTPLMANMIEDGATPMATTKELEEIGFSFVVHPCALTYAQTYADEEVLTELHDTGRTTKTQKQMVTFDKFNHFVGLDELNQCDNQYSAEAMTDTLALIADKMKEEA